jgi:hypothetical protein
LGFFLNRNLLKFLGYQKVLLLFPALYICNLLGFFTIQTSGGVNVYNFFSVSIIIVSLFSAYFLSKVKLNFMGIILLTIFIALTIPRSIHEVADSWHQYGSNDLHAISINELKAFAYIKQNLPKNAIVQASPDNALDRETPYVAFFSDRNSYLSGAGLLGTHNVNVADKRQNLDEIFKSNNIADFVKNIKQKNISYIYLQKDQQLKFKIDENYLKEVYTNDDTSIIEIK